MMKLVPATVAAMTTKIAFTLLCCTVLMLVAAPARADICTGASPATTAPCDVTVTITGSTGNLSVKIVDLGTNYPGAEGDDKLIGIQNSSSVSVGAIVLSGSDAFDVFSDNDGACTAGLFSPGFNCGPSGYEGPNNTFLGISPDKSTGKVLFTTPLAAGGTAVFSLEAPPTAVVAVGEAKTLTASATTFPFGPFVASGGGVFVETPGPNQATPDDYQITALSALTPGADMMTITAIPVSHFGVLGSLTHFSTLDCIPYADYSTAAGSATCVEVERDCSGLDCPNLVYSATLDFNIDTSVGNIGGAAFLGQAGAACPTTGFDRNITTSYTGSQVGTVDPLKGGSGGGSSCYMGAFDPSAPTVAPGVTISTFFGFEFPVSNTKVNPILRPIPVLLNWDLKDTSGNPVTNLILCPNTSCPTGGANPPWVNLSLIALTPNVGNCTAIATASSPLPSVPNLLVKGHPPLGLVNFGKGEYSFAWNTATNLNLKGCQVRVVAQFSSGAFDAPAVFQYAY